MTTDDLHLFDEFALPLIEAEADSLRILAMNEAACRLSGFDAAEALQLTLACLFPHLDAGSLRCRTVPGSQTEPGTLQLQGRVLAAKDGSRRSVDIRVRENTGSTPATLTLLLLDASGRQLAQDQLHYVLRATQLGYWDWDLVRGSFDVDTHWLGIYGRARDEIATLPEGTLDLLHPDDAARVRDSFLAHIRYDDNFSLDFRAIHGSGRTIWIRLAAAVVSRDLRSGEPLRVCGTVQDITSQNSAQQELRKMQKLASLGVLAGGIAHDFNNILTALFGNLALARSHLPPDHRAQASLDSAEQAFQRATQLTSQLLTFAKGGDPVRQDVRIAPFIEECVRFDLADGTVQLVFKAAPDLWQARVDKVQMAQVFSNLASNASQAMPAGGTLHIDVENCTLQDDAVPGLAAGDYLRISLRDEGVGIAPGDIDRIFDPYFSTKEQGSGLGLATVYSIITKHGGHVAVDSAPGEGATFTLYLPAANGKTAAPASLARPTPPRKKASSRILIMDDEEMICRLGTMFLGSKGYVVSTASDGREAIALYREALQRGEPFDCLLMDLTIPGGMGGQEALAQILQMDPAACAIVSSGYAADPVMAHHEAHGFRGCITKPFQLATLLAEIRRVLGDAPPAA